MEVATSAPQATWGGGRVFAVDPDMPELLTVVELRICLSSVCFKLDDDITKAE